MPEIDLPEMDPRDEDEVVSDVTDDLPDSLTDRNRSATSVKLIEAVGTMYGLILYYLARWPRRLMLRIYELLGLEPQAATAATVELEFTTDGDSDVTIDEGTEVKDGPGADAITFATTAELVVSGGTTTGTVDAECTETGTDGNVGADTLTELGEPISGVESVTNPDPASGGDDEETLDSLEDRAPLAIRSNERAITDEDFETHAIDESDVGKFERAQATGDSGVVAVALVADDLNEGADTSDYADWRDDLQDELHGKTVPGVLVQPEQDAIRLWTFQDGGSNGIGVELAEGYTASQIEDDVEAALIELGSALPVEPGDMGDSSAHEDIDTDGWEWGATLYHEQIIAAVAQVEGVVRVGGIDIQHTDDYWDSTTAEDAWTGELGAAWAGNADDTIGMLHFDHDEASGYVYEL